MQCKYCYGKCIEDLGQPFPFEVDDSLPTSINYRIEELAEFLCKDPNPSVIFYGGEPLLDINSMKQIMDLVTARSFVIQTNGLLLNQLESTYLNRLNTILVSLDGNEALTDCYRGEGTYRRVVENLKAARLRGFTGEIVARMTVGPETDLQEAVNWLLFNPELPFKSVHWQLDAQFWKRDFNEDSVRSWFNRYNKQVSSLIENWADHIEKTGTVQRIYPFVGVMNSLLREERTKLRCGAGWIEFNIQTDGNISPCPVMAGMKCFYLGNIRDKEPRELENAISIGEPCWDCTILGLCGGRCLYANATMLWGDVGFRLVCETVRNLVDSLKRVEPRISRLISEGKISITDLEYPRYNSCEIIP